MVLAALRGVAGPGSSLTAAAGAVGQHVLCMQLIRRFLLRRKVTAIRAQVYTDRCMGMRASGARRSARPTCFFPMVQGLRTLVGLGGHLSQCLFGDGFVGQDDALATNQPGGDCQRT
jgi:hypothetical protein